MFIKRGNLGVRALSWLPAGRLHATMARRMAGRGDPRALVLGPGDAIVLSRLGLHRSVLELGLDEKQACHLIALAATGDIRAMLAGLGRRHDLPPAEQRRLALAAAPFDPHVALALAQPNTALERAAIALAAGNTELAAKSLGTEAGREAELVRAAIAQQFGQFRRAREHFNNAFACDALEPPANAETGEPLTLGWLRARVRPGSVDGPLLSVIVPFRHAAATLGFSIRSILGQSWRALEILMVADRPDDASMRTAQMLCGTDPRLRLLDNQQEPGAGGARSSGVANASGEWIMLHDSDDWAHPRRIERQFAAGDGGASVAHHVRIDRSGCPMSPHVAPLSRLSPACLLARRDIMISAGPFDAAPAGSDSEFLARLDLLLGRRKVKREGSLLTVASWLDESISGDPSSGLASSEGRHSRENYRRAWMVRHAGVKMLG